MIKTNLIFSNILAPGLLPGQFCLIANIRHIQETPFKFQVSTKSHSTQSHLNIGLFEK